MVDSFETHATVDDRAQNPVSVLCDASGLPAARIKHAMTCGAVWLTRGARSARIRRRQTVLELGDQLHLYYNPEVLAQRPIAAELIEDAGVFSVWDKPSGVRSQGSKWGDHTTIMRWSERHLVPPRTTYTVHRLDLAASGLMVIAHSKKAAAALSAQFRARTVAKRYRAVVRGAWPHGDAGFVIDEPIDGKSARSTVFGIRIDERGESSIVEVVIETGRKHQIRRHLADQGFPIVGDRLYGGAAKHDPDLMLRAIRLAFDHPEDGSRRRYRAD
ncbi:MAG: RluA family pseudouridine synthase [Pseudomonadota bacterium]